MEHDVVDKYNQGEDPMPKSSDVRYSLETKKKFAVLADKVKSARDKESSTD